MMLSNSLIHVAISVIGWMACGLIFWMLVLGARNIIQWLFIKRDELKIKQAHIKVSMLKWKRDDKLYDKYLR